MRVDVNLVVQCILVHHLTSTYETGYAPLPPQDSELLLSLNEDADWVMGTLANIGGGTGRCVIYIAASRIGHICDAVLW